MQLQAVCSSSYPCVLLALSKNIPSVFHFLPEVFACFFECYYNPQDVDLCHVVGVAACPFPVAMHDSNLQMDFVSTPPTAFATLNWL